MLLLCGDCVGAALQQRWGCVGAAWGGVGAAVGCVGAMWQCVGAARGLLENGLLWCGCCVGAAAWSLRL